MFNLETQEEIDEVNNFAMLLLRKTRPHLSDYGRWVIAHELIKKAMEKLSQETEREERNNFENYKEICEEEWNNYLPVSVNEKHIVRKKVSQETEKPVNNKENCKPKWNPVPIGIKQEQKDIKKSSPGPEKQQKTNNCEPKRNSMPVRVKPEQRGVNKSLGTEKHEQTHSKENCELKRNNSLPLRVKQRVEFRFSAKPSTGKEDKRFSKPKVETPEDICRAKRRSAYLSRKLAQEANGPDSGRSSACSNSSVNENQDIQKTKRRSDSGRCSNNSLSENCCTSTPRKLAGEGKFWRKCCANKNLRDCKKVYVDDISNGAPQIKKKRTGSEESLTESEDSCLASTSSTCSDLDDVFTRLSLGKRR